MIIIRILVRRLQNSKWNTSNQRLKESELIKTSLIIMNYK